MLHRATTSSLRAAEPMGAPRRALAVARKPAVHMAPWTTEKRHANLQRTRFRKNEEGESSEQTSQRQRTDLFGRKVSQPQTEDEGTQTATPQATTLASMAYGALALCTTVASASALIFPQQLATLILNYSPSPLGVTMVRLAGASLILDIAAKVTLMEQQPVDRSDESARQAASHLNLALLVQSVGTLVLLVQAVSIRNPALMGSIGLLAAATAFVSGAEFIALRPPRNQVVPATRRLTARIVSFFVPETLPALLYSVATIALGLGGYRMLYAYPGAVLAPFAAPLDAVMALAARATGWGLVLAALVTLVLRDVCDRPRPGKMPVLTGEPFRVLNLGLAGSMLAGAAVIGLGAAGSGVVATGKVLWGTVAGLCCIGAWAGFQSSRDGPVSVDV